MKDTSLGSEIKIDDTAWSFHFDGHQIANSLNPEIYSQEPFEALVHDFNGSVTKKDDKIDEITLKLKNHGKHNYVSTLELSVNGKKVDLIYNKRKTLKNFIGLKKHNHEIALPHESEVDEELQPYLKKIFGDKKVVKVSTQVNSQTLKIKLPKGVCFNLKKLS
ncbi:MAG: hypothetical protein VX777_02915 [Chlamydiota bacterium]|nr:hypothetical protein [Chlamydiota bacterium]